MPIFIRESADPMSAQARQSRADSIGLDCAAARILQFELQRYCKGQITGRSFLIAGHRGAGKTTMVAGALDQVAWDCRQEQKWMRPLPVLLHGPSLFDTLPSDLKSKDGAAADDDSVTAPAKSEEELKEMRCQVALEQIILGMHRAVVKEFASAYRRRLAPRSGDEGEFAAQFEIELLEDPPASRLREFWRRADALSKGVLFDVPSAPDQGARELVALNGICNAHQRISGDLRERDEAKRNATISEERSSGFDLKVAEAIKPLGVVLAGSVVAGGAAASSPTLLMPAVLGVATAWLGSMFIKRTSGMSLRRERQVDRTFIPDLSIRTLGRIVPMLLDRLRDAGLAPVLVVDELDKVTRLSERIVGMILHMKKLVAENVFSCFLTDRGYIEDLRINSGKEAYGKEYSYFSHPLLIAFKPADFDSYLERLLRLSDEPNVAAQQAAPAADDGDTLDKEVLKWFLRHRSQMHALALSRELAAIRGEAGRVRIAKGSVRSDSAYQVHVTFQVAIELQLCSRHIADWLMQKPEMLQTLYDALYFLSRRWANGEEYVAIDTEVLRRELELRMNLKEVRESLSATPAAEAAASLSDDDLKMLRDVVGGMVSFLGQARTREQAQATWERIEAPTDGSAAAKPPQSVMDAALFAGESLLIELEGKAREAALKKLGDRASKEPPDWVIRWRYWPSGTLRDEIDAQKRDWRKRLPEVTGPIAYIKAVEENLWKVFKSEGEPAEPDGRVYRILADQCRVLKTTPAWEQVVVAIDNISRIESGHPTLSVLEANFRAVKGFEQMLRDNTEGVQFVIRTAAMLGPVLAKGAGREHKRAGDLRECVAILSRAFEFAKLDPAGVLKRLQECVPGLQLALNIPSVEPVQQAADAPPTDQPTGLDTYDVVADVSAAEARGARANPALDVLTRDAWGDLRVRLEERARSGTQHHAYDNEIACAILGVGPDRAFLDIGAVSVPQWSAVLLQLGTPAVPSWIAGFALEALGAGTLGTHILQRLAQSLASMLDSPDLAHSFRVAMELGLLRGGPNSKLVLVVRNERGSVTRRWTQLPTRGFIIVATAAQLRAATALPYILTNLGPEHIQVAIEEPSDFNLEEVLRMVPVRDSALYHLYAAETKEMHEPFIVDPVGPDDVLMR